MKLLSLIALLILTATGCRTTHPTCRIPVSQLPPPPAVANLLPGEVLAQDLSFDAATGALSYSLPEPAVVRIRIGLRDGGPMLRTLADWEEQSKGPHTMAWDKKDATGQVDFSFRNDFMAVVACLALDSHARARYDGPIKGFRKSPDPVITFPESLPHKESGAPLVKGIVPVRITVADKDQQWLSESKYEISIFVDTVFLMEDEEGTSPFTYRIDTRGLGNGLHSMTVNFVGYTGEIGTASVIFYVQNE